MKIRDQNLVAANFPAYEPDDGPLSAKQVAALRKDVQAHFPRGALLSRQTLFEDIKGSSSTKPSTDHLIN